MGYKISISITAKNRKRADKQFKERTKRYLSNIKINEVTKKKHIVYIYTYDMTLTPNV